MVSSIKVLPKIKMIKFSYFDVLGEQGYHNGGNRKALKKRSA